MAEVLGVVAGGAGLASLAIQLGQNAVKVRRLYKTLKAAPEILEDLADRLKLFSLIIQSLDEKVATNVQECVNRCNKIVEQLDVAVTRLNVKMKSSNARGRLQTVAKHPEILDLCHELDQATGLLTLAWQIDNEAKRRKNETLLLQKLEASSVVMSRPQSMCSIHAQNLEQKGPSSLNANEKLGLVHRSSQGTQGDGVTASQKAPEIEIVRDLDLRHKSTRYGDRRKWRLRISPWFTSRIWGLSFDAAPIGWDFALRTSNLVPADSLIFELCGEGNLREVQRLFRQGKASPYDYCDSRRWGDTCVLEAAATSGNVQLCQYLIDEGGWPLIPKTSFGPLSEYVCALPEIPINMSAVQDMYRLLLEQQDIDMYDLIDHHEQTPWWWGCPDVSCMKLIKSSFPTPYAELPLEARLKMAINRQNNCAWWQEMFFEMLDCNCIDSRLATSADTSGNTVLHMIAGRMAYDGHASAPVYPPAELVKYLLDLGADVHKRNEDGQTPLVFLFRHFSLATDTDVALQRWVRALDFAGVDLSSYGQIEKDIWKSLLASGSLFSYRPIISEWTFGARVVDWTVHSQEYMSVSIYEPRCIPGALSSLCERNTWSLPWYPEEEDALEAPWSWSETREIVLRQTTIPWSAREEQDTRAIAFQTLLTGSQDDCGEVVRLVDESFKPRCRPRSGSQPSMKRLSGDLIWPIARKPPIWFAPCHFCPFDGRAKFGHNRQGFGYYITGVNGSLRKCAKDIHEYEPDTMWKGITKEMRSFRRQYHDIAELQNLPPRAYHPVERSS